MRLVSYLYYVKFTYAGDNTFFRHIDLNIARLLADGYGQNIIQGAISLDYKSKGNYIEIVPGFHKVID